MSKKISISKDELYSLYVVSGNTSCDIAKLFGVHRTTIDNRLKEFGIDSCIENRNRRVKERRLTPKQKEFIMGSVLGDGHITGGKRISRYSTSHSVKQKNYIEWVKSIFGDFGGEIKKYKAYNKRYSKIYEFCSFATLSIPELINFRTTFYDKAGKKIIPRNIKEILISPLSLAVWIMEDGYFNKRNKSTYLCTDCFSYDEHKLLVDALNSNFSIKPKIIKYKDNFRLRFGAAEANMISEISKPHIVDSMSYKISNL